MRIVKFSQEETPVEIPSVPTQGNHLGYVHLEKGRCTEDSGDQLNWGLSTVETAQPEKKVAVKDDEKKQITKEYSIDIPGPTLIGTIIADEFGWRIVNELVRDGKILNEKSLLSQSQTYSPELSAEENLKLAENKLNELAEMLTEIHSDVNEPKASVTQDSQPEKTDIPKFIIKRYIGYSCSVPVRVTSVASDTTLSIYVLDNFESEECYQNILMTKCNITNAKANENSKDAETFIKKRYVNVVEVDVTEPLQKDQGEAVKKLDMCSLSNDDLNKEKGSFFDMELNYMAYDENNMPHRLKFSVTPLSWSIWIYDGPNPKRILIRRDGDIPIDTNDAIQQAEKLMKSRFHDVTRIDNIVKKVKASSAYGETVENRSVMKNWTTRLSWKAQTVLISSIRGCDAVGKNDISKKIIRKLRATVLNNAGPEGAEFITSDITESELYDFSKNIDAYPVHFLLHLIHACEIIGYEYHEDEDTKQFFMYFYLMMVSAFHMEPESREQMKMRLKDGVETCCHKT